MIETRRLKNVAIFIQTILSFVLSRKITSKIIRRDFFVTNTYIKVLLDRLFQMLF